MTTKCFKAADCFQGLHCIVKSVTWPEILKKPYSLQIFQNIEQMLQRPVLIHS